MSTGAPRMKTLPKPHLSIAPTTVLSVSRLKYNTNKPFISGTGRVSCFKLHNKKPFGRMSMLMLSHIRQRDCRRVAGSSLIFVIAQQLILLQVCIDFLHTNTKCVTYVTAATEGSDKDSWVSLQEEVVGILSSVTETEKHADPGGVLWHNLQVDTHNEDHVILQRFSFHIQNGQLTGLLGPSGSGKSTLLQSIAGLCPLNVHGIIGRYETNSFMETDTDSDSKDHVLVDHSDNSKRNKFVAIHSVSSAQTAWLQQHDDFFTELTVQETLQLSAFLELPHASFVERHELVERTLANLGLTHAKHRPIGALSNTKTTTNSWSKKFRRIKNRVVSGGRLSGGERRRLSVALELLTQKDLLLGDEPTSGLDSAYAVTVINLLKQLAVARQIPALISLHQPRSRIWRTLDAVILLASQGRVCFAGSREQVLPYFAKLGFQLPPDTNPAEWLIDLISVDAENNIKAMEDEARIETLAHAFNEHQQKHIQQQYHVFTKKKRNLSPIIKIIGDRDTQQYWRNWQKQPKRGLAWILPRRLGALLLRCWRQNIRNTNLNWTRLIISAGNALLLSVIFPSVSGPVPLVNSIADRCALLSFAAINLTMISYMKTVTLFAQERPVLEREQMREQYSSLEYVLAKILGEIPLDVGFAAVFTAVLKKFSGLLISWKTSMSVFSLLTIAGASMGFALGSISPTGQHATTAGIPVLVILMVVGVINPSGVDPNKPPPWLVRSMKQLSPFAFAIEALCIGEYRGVMFMHSKRFLTQLKGATRIGGLAFLQDGDQVLEALGLKTQTIAGAMKHLGLISVGNILFSWIGLVFQNRKQRQIQKHRQSLARSPSLHPNESSKITSTHQKAIAQIPTRVRL